MQPPPGGSYLSWPVQRGWPFTLVCLEHGTFGIRTWQVTLPGTTSPPAHCTHTLGAFGMFLEHWPLLLPLSRTLSPPSLQVATWLLSFRSQFKSHLLCEALLDAPHPLLTLLYFYHSSWLSLSGTTSFRCLFTCLMSLYSSRRWALWIFNEWMKRINENVNRKSYFGWY